MQLACWYFTGPAFHRLNFLLSLCLHLLSSDLFSGEAVQYLKASVYRGSPGHPDTVLIHSEDSSDVAPVDTNEFHYPGNANVILSF